MKGLLIAAPTSGAGKTTTTLGLLRALKRRGVCVASAKSGPDYIDPQFHSAATGRPCSTLDAWAMQRERLAQIAGREACDVLIIEGAMGLFDGAPPDGDGSCADLASALGLPVLLIVDCARMSQSVAALVAGYANHRSDIRIAALILNNVGSARHEAMLRHALRPLEIPVLGALKRNSKLSHPSRHLGLMQAEERADLEEFLECAADQVDQELNIDAILACAETCVPWTDARGFAPLGQRIAVAYDQAFRFVYPHLLEDWRKAGAEISFFSPLENEAPAQTADAVYMPGGYPELHADRLARADRLKAALTQTEALVYGECGGFMVLGDGLIDAEGGRHQMLGLLRLETSFAMPKRHLGYRNVTALHGPLSGAYKAHEFHYSTTTKQKGTPLFKAFDAEGTPLEEMGIREGRVFGSYAHLISPAL